MNSILVIGLGRFGSYVAMRCLQEGCEVVAVESSEERASRYVNDISNIEIADMQEPEVVKSMGVGNFDVCVVAIGDDFARALEITVLLKDYGARQVVARANSEVHKRLLLRNGADQVMFAEQIVAESLAVSISSDKVFDYFRLSDELGIYEISAPQKWIGRSLKEMNIRQKYDVSVVAVRREGKLSPMIDPDQLMRESDRLLVIGTDAVIQRLTK